MFEKLTHEEAIKLNDFMSIYREYLNPNCDKDLDIVIDYIIDLMIKIYIEYKDDIPFISIKDDNYKYYILKPSNGQYCLLDYLINKAIQNLDSLELIDGKMSCNYNMLKKRISINRNNVYSLHESVLDATKHGIDKDKYLELYFKHFIYHELCHMFHYTISEIEENTIYVPSDYLVSDVMIQKRGNKREERNRDAECKQSALERMQKRIGMYGKLKDKYSILSPNEIESCYVKTEMPAIKYEAIFLPPYLYQNPVEEAFTDCEAQVYSGIFENDIFDVNENGTLNCFYIPVDDEHVIMTYCPNAYSFSASIAFALKECISKQSYFRTFFLGKSDLFIDFLGSYDPISANNFSCQLMDANKRKFEGVNSLLESIVNFRKEHGISSKSLNIYFPLVYKDGKWVYYIDSLENTTPKVLKKENKN